MVDSSVFFRVFFLGQFAAFHGLVNQRNVLSNSSIEIVLNTSSASIQGRARRFETFFVDEFYSIPYGEENSFSTIDDHFHLQLNIFLPRTENIKPILVFTQDALSSTFDPSTIAAFSHIILVTIKHRRNAIDHPTDISQNTSINIALHDQILALKWISRNSVNFQGDSSRITYFGYSAGAVNGILLSMSSSSEKLIRRVVALDGTPFHRWSVDQQYAFNLKNSFGGTIEEEILHNESFPMIDKEFSPSGIDRLSHVDLLVGSQKSEIFSIFRLENRFFFNRENLRKILGEKFGQFLCYFDEIREKYGLSESKIKLRFELMEEEKEIFDDVLFNFDLIRFLHERSRNRPKASTYVVFEENSMGKGSNRIERFFNEPNGNVSWKKICFLTNFVKTGNPNEPSNCSILWPIYEENRREFLLWNSEQIRGEKNFLEEKFHFWNFLLNRPLCTPLYWYQTFLLIFILVLVLLMIVIYVFYNAKRSRRNIKPMETRSIELLTHYHYLPSVVT